MIAKAILQVLASQPHVCDTQKGVCETGNTAGSECQARPSLSQAVPACPSESQPVPAPERCLCMHLFTALGRETRSLCSLHSAAQICH